MAKWHKYKQRVLPSLQLVSMALLIGISLYIYNDWRVHRTLAAPAQPGNSSQGAGSIVETPLTGTGADQGVSGTVEVGPDGKIKQKSGNTVISKDPATRP